MDTPSAPPPLSVPPVPGKPEAVLRVLRTTGLGLLRGRRGAALGGLVLVPLILMLAGRLAGGTRGMGTLFFTRTLVPSFHYIDLVVFLFLGCSILGEGISEGSLIYDLACPLRRSAVFTGRFLAYLFSAWLLVLPAVTLAYGVCMAPLGGEAVVRGVPLLSALLAVTAVGAAVYGAFFVLLSLLMKRAVLVGIVLAVAVDGFLAFLPLRLSHLSPQVHLRNVAARLASEPRLLEMVEGVTVQVPFTTSVVVLALAFLCFFAAGIVLFQGKEFP